MATFNFSTITAAQALAFTAADTLLIDEGPAHATTVLSQADTMADSERARAVHGLQRAELLPERAQPSSRGSA